MVWLCLKFRSKNDPIFISTTSPFYLSITVLLLKLYSFTYNYKDSNTTYAELFFKDFTPFILGSIIFKSHIVSKAFLLIVKGTDPKTYCEREGYCSKLSLARRGDCFNSRIRFFSSKVLKVWHYCSTFLNKLRLVTSYKLLDVIAVLIFFSLDFPTTPYTWIS
jgi:hypothetical protein